MSDLKDVEKNGLTVFSCFAGGGGSSQGYKMAGFDVIGCNEIDPRQMEIYKANLNPKHSYLMDIRDFRELDDLPSELFELDILDASFPCSLFSNANQTAHEKKGKKVKFREGQTEQVLDDLAFETIKLVDKLRPKVVIFENVKGLLAEKNKWYVEQIYEQFHKIGYGITHKLINCADLGVPQKRQRVFFFATRNDLNIDTCDLFGCEPKLNLNIKEKHISIGELDLDKTGKLPTPHIASLLEDYRDGDDALGDIRFRRDGKTTGFQCVFLKRDTICNTLRAGANDFMKVEDDFRNLSDHELLQVGAWSQDYDFKKQRVIYVLGMSVPPLAMYRISKEIQKQWFKKD